jgi:uncharacterized caspase-like protein
MPLIRNFVAILGLLVALTIGVAPSAAHAEQRIALVLGNAAYATGALKPTANDAGLIAQTLEAAGFEVMGARDLDHEALQRAFRDFVDKAATLGPDDVAVVYLGGYGLQLEGENYFVPIDARIERASDIPVQAVRISDYTRALSALKLKACIVILDLARSHQFVLKGEPVAGGLALVEADAGMLIAFNAAPGTIAPAADGDYGPYAKALAEMIREGGLPLDAVFDRARLRVSDATQGAQVPWHASSVAGAFVFFERTADAPPSVAVSEPSPALRSRPIRDLGAQEAYIAALERDTLPDYSEFLDTYPNDPVANRVRAIVAARREALTWRRTRWFDTPAAYWSYLRLYSDGPHVADCYRRLVFLHASLEPPLEFSAIDYDIPPPPLEEGIYLQQPVIFLGDPTYDFPPPPPIAENFLPPPSPEFTELPPPEPPQALFVLPTPVYTPVPVWVRPPHNVQPPPANNVIFANVHNRIVMDGAAKTFTVTERGGQTRTLPAPPVFQDNIQTHAGARRELPGSGANLGPALPPSLAQLATGTDGTTNQLPRRERLEQAQRADRPGLPIRGATEPPQPGTPGGSTATTRQLSSQPTQPNPFWSDTAQRHGAGVASGSSRQAPPLPKAGAPVVSRAATTTTPPGSPAQREPGQGLWRERPPQPLSAGSSPTALPRHGRSSAQAGQFPAAPQTPAAAHPQPPQALPKGVPPSGIQAVPTGQPQQLDRQHTQQEVQQRAQQEQAAAQKHQQAAEMARQAGSAAAVGQQQAAHASVAAARGQLQAVQAAGAARAQQQAAQAAAAQQQAAQAAAAARAQQQAAQAAAAAHSQQQPAQAAAAARAQQQAAQAAAAARAQQQAAQAAAAARAQQQAAQAAAAARAQQQAAQAAAAARAQQQAAQAAAAARAQQQAAQAAAAARAQQQAGQAAAAARASSAVAAARAQHSHN